MGTGLGIAALVVAIVSAAFAYKAWRAADRSADSADRSASAAESADRREREPRLSVLLDSPSPAPVDGVIYRLRNDGPQDLESVVVYRPRPDRITYPLAITGQDWAEDDIVFGPLAVTAEVRFTLCCGAALDLPEFWVRIICRAGEDEWLLSRRLPAPRGEPLSPEEIAARHEVLTAALDEIERDIRTAKSANWYLVPRRARFQHLEPAQRWNLSRR